MIQVGDILMYRKPNIFSPHCIGVLDIPEGNKVRVRLYANTHLFYLYNGNDDVERFWMKVE